MARKRPRKRDYKAEYQRRLARAKKRGLPKSIARGHPGKGKLGLRASKFLGVEPGYVAQYTPRAILREIMLADTARGLRREYARVLRTSQREAREQLVKQKGETANDYGLRRDEVLSDAKPSDLPLTSEVDFIRSMNALGFSEREAYTLWFSP